MKFSTFVLTLIISLWARADVLQKTLDKLSKASSIQFDIKKTDEKIILGTKFETTGVLKYQKQKLYILQTGEKKIELFFSEALTYLVEYPDSDFNKSGNRKVSVFRKASLPLIKILNIFSNTRSFNKDFTVISKEENEGVLTLKFNSKFKNIKQLALKIKSNDLILQELSFVDDVETKTSIEFSNMKLNTPLNKRVFQFKALKSDEVIIE